MADEDYALEAVKMDPETSYLCQKKDVPKPDHWLVYPPNKKPHWVEYQDIEAWVDLVPAPSEPEA